MRVSASLNSGGQTVGSALESRGELSRAAWLRSRLLRLSDPLSYVAYSMVLVSIGFTLTVSRPNLPAWRWLAVLVALLGVLAAQIAKPNTDELVAHKGRGRPYVLASGACTIVALLLDPSFPETLLLFMVTSQAFVFLRLRTAFLLVLPLPPLVVFSEWLAGRPSEYLAETAVEAPIGFLFTAMLSAVLNNYYTQRHRAEVLARQLATANAEILAAREREKELATVEERIRIARDIHDGLGHHLTILSIQLQAASKVLPRDPTKAADLLGNCRREVQEALGEVRRSVDVMRRGPLDDRPIDVAVRKLVEEFDQRASLRATFASSGTPVTLPADTAIILYRAAQEGLTNAQKYAAATVVAVTLDYAPTTVRLTVQDDGQGSTPATSEQSGGGFGLRGLRERAEGLRGTFSAAPTREGFTLTLELPCGPAPTLVTDAAS